MKTKARKTLARLFSVLTLLAIFAAGLEFYGPRPTPPSPEISQITGQIDRILVEKSARRMTIFQNGRAMRTYNIALGFTPQGDKQRQGDGRTPEGVFHINRRNATSAYHLSLGIDYPQTADILRASAGGYNPGGDIFFHGQPNAFAGKPMLHKDWTAGCIALTDAEIEQLWAITPIGTKVEIRP